MSDLYTMVKKAGDFIRSKTSTKPETGIVLGTGLGGLAQEILVEIELPYSDIPGFVTSTVESHEGKLIIGTLSGKNVVAMQGRFHYYEGYSMQEITFPVRVMNEIGAKKLIVSNAAGGMNLDFSKGDLVLLNDHINLLGDNPLIGVTDDRLGSRFPDMGVPYSKELMVCAKDAANELGISLAEGVYVAVSGPSLETPAEYRFLRLIGADMVGMSTVPENIVAKQAGMDVLGITIISDMCDPDNLEPANITDIIATCNKAEPNLTALVKKVVSVI